METNTKSSYKILVSGYVWFCEISNFVKSGCFWAYHHGFTEWYFGYDDAIYASARLLETLSQTEKYLKELLADILKMVNIAKIRMDCPDDKKFQVVAKLVEEFKKNYEVIDADGARVLFDGGWGLIKVSNTQPVSVLRFEA